MMNLLRNPLLHRRATRLTAKLLFLFAGAALAFAFWTATIPVATAAQMTPTEMIQSNLPAKKTLATANKAELLSAVCEAVRKFKGEAPQIVKVAVQARKKYAADIVSTAIRCLGQPLDCSFVASIVNRAVDAASEYASSIVDAALLLAPDCRSQIQHAASGDAGEGNFGNGPVNQNGPPGSVPSGGGGFDPEQGKVLICHNGHTLILPPKAAEKQLREHPGDYAGPCNVTQTTNK